MIDVLVVCGPTASGKTGLSIKLAKERGGELICADSMQVYKYMDIGTAKPTLQEMQESPHHLFGIIEPTNEFSLADYAPLAHEKIKEIHKRGKLPILVGGTGLYIDTVINNIKLQNIPKNNDFRQKVESIETIDLHKRLHKIDPKHADKIKDRRRIIRALEILDAGGVLEKCKGEQLYKTEFISIDIDRNVLYERINKRVDEMIKAGLVPEVKSLLKNGMSKTARQAIGYKETIEYLENKTTLEEAIDSIKQNTRNYAKRQMTWFRHH